MSDRVGIPGYGGYQRHFIRDSSLIPSIPAHKYNDLFRPSASPAQANNVYQSLYQRSFSAEQLKQRDSQTFNYNSVAEAGRNVPMDPRPPVWGSSYRDSFQPPKKVDKSPLDNINKGASIPQYLSSVPQSRNLLRAAKNYDWASAYQIDYGNKGEAPVKRVEEKDKREEFKENPSQLSNVGTSRDFFLGSPKATAAYRIPGYGGHCGESNFNRNLHLPKRNFVEPLRIGEKETANGTVRGLSTGVIVPEQHFTEFPPAQPVEENRNRFVKDNLLDSFRLNMSSYSGHVPKDVKNATRPRSPSSMRPLQASLHASLMLDSMKV